MISRAMFASVRIFGVGFRDHLLSLQTSSSPPCLPVTFSPEIPVHLLVLASGDSGMVSITLERACGRPSTALLSIALLLLHYT